MLDYAIGLACSNYKSALTNLKRGNIKHFRIRYWKFNRKNKILDIEPQYFTNKTICPKIFGQIKCSYDGKEYELDEINSTCKLHYDKMSNKYTLLVPEKIKTEKCFNKRKIIFLDPGIRTFMTGLSEDEVIKIGWKAKYEIERYLVLIDEKKKKNIPNKKKKKIEKLYNRKISSLVDDLHWKTIKYLTNKYKNILVGDMSVKGITNNETSNLTPINKRLAYRLKFY